jgi:hypothetical protein
MYVFNMSASLARQGCRVQVEQSDMRFDLKMAKMATGVLSRATIEKMKQLIMKPAVDV